MGRSARSRDRDDDEESAVGAAVAALGGLAFRNPAVTGGTTAFLVTLAFVSANALFYQPHFHDSAFFATRDATGQIATSRAGEQPPRRTTPPRESDARLAEVQSALAARGHYDGEIDGIPGPATKAAIEAFQRANGLPVNGLADGRLLDSIGIDRPTAAVPEPLPTARPSIEPPDANDPAADTRKVQAGLKAFGNDGIEIDGVLGTRTRSAIKEFQSLFGLPETGEVDATLVAKMRDVGLIN
ncbi:MAG: peptidoglycan-binding protein [Rhizobiaceae bacterium]